MVSEMCTPQVDESLTAVGTFLAGIKRDKIVPAYNLRPPPPLPGESRSPTPMNHECNMAKVLIDANIYLTAYETQGHGIIDLLSTLPNIKESIFVSQQIVAEVSRRKLEVFLECFSKTLAATPKPNLPSHISGKAHADQSGIPGKINALKDLSRDLDLFMEQTLSKVSKSEDEVSEVLSRLFENATPPSDSEISAARCRREVGNPPGKSTSPLGDQIVWEQFKNSIKKESHIWIISKDSDYVSEYRKSFYLNSYLHSELLQINKIMEVYCFKSLADGMSHYYKKNKTAPNPPSEEVIKQAAKEEAAAEMGVPGNSRMYCYGCKAVQPCRSMKIPSAYHDVITLHYRCAECGNMVDTGQL